jgi:hypothetical protein
MKHSNGFGVCAALLTAIMWAAVFFGAQSRPATTPSPLPDSRYTSAVDIEMKELDE